MGAHSKKHSVTGAKFARNKLQPDKEWLTKYCAQLYYETIPLSTGIGMEPLQLRWLSKNSGLRSLDFSPERL